MAAWAGDDKQFIVDNVDTTKHIVTLKKAGDAYYRPGLEEPLVLVNSMSMLLKAINVTVTGEMWGLTRDETNNVRYNPTPGDPSSWVECSGTLVQISISACGKKKKKYSVVFEFQYEFQYKFKSVSLTCYYFFSLFCFFFLPFLFLFLFRQSRVWS